MSYSLINCRNRKDSKKSWRQTEQVMEIAKVVSLRSHPQPWQTKAKRSGVSAATSGAVSVKPVSKGCGKCGGKGAIECPGCKGTGKNKKNGNIFERWKCFDCQGFGLKSCPSCGKGGLTPEQRGER